VYAICSDGDLMEGVSSEAASLAGHLGLANLCWIYDNNTITIDGHTDIAFTEDVAMRFRAYRWNVLRVRDANDTARVAAALTAFRRTRDRPTLIIVDSVIAYGAPHKQNTPAAHGEPLGEDEVRLVKRFYGWPEEAQFLVPDGVRERFDAGIGKRGQRTREAWQRTLAAWQREHPQLARELSRQAAGELPKGWDAKLPEFAAEGKGIATREAGGKVLSAIGERVPWLIGGAADLATSTKTKLSSDERNLHFGVREHAMGAIVNGMVLSGMRAFGSSFLIFSDYMRPPLRLAALMKVPAFHVFSHDSIGLGEDGPTHQPVEQLAGLRAIPGMVVLRPADANEAREAYRVILALRARPACLVLSRQALPVFDRKRYAGAEGLARGGYVMADARQGTPEVILIASGSEVQLCVTAFDQLAREGIAARVVSLPSWELFEEQDAQYRAQVLPPGVAARVAVEAGAALGWERYAGNTGAIIAMRSFGGSAPAGELMKKFGFTPEAVVRAAKAQLARSRPMNPLKALLDHGQAVWLDFVSRELLDKGELARLIERDGLRGVTSNPTIFEKAIGHSTDYDASIRRLLNDERTVEQTLEALMVEDIRHAADVLRPVFDATDGADGFVSIEVSPYLANDTKGTIAEAKRLWSAVDRKNLMVKVPATQAGLPAIRELTAQGINVNITLLFAQEVYEQVALAYIAGLEALAAAKGDVARVSSVASFFVSRIDTAVDKLLEEKIAASRDAGEKARLAQLEGKVAIANAKLAAQRYKRLFAGERWKALERRGARTQRLLWASTGTKNKAYSDVLYVEELVGPDTINTMPPATLDSFRDHGRIRGDTLEEDLEGARRILDALDSAGISLDAVTDHLTEEGVRLFTESNDKVLDALREKRRTLATRAAA